MFPREPANHIHWTGKQSLEVIKGLLSDQVDTVIELPMNVHHALYSHLNPDAPPGPIEHVDISGTEELLSRVAEVAGLEPIIEIAETVKQQHGTVSVLSPPSRILVAFSGPST